MSVDIKTGKSIMVPPQKSARELLTESLPADVTLGFNDVVSPDMQSVIIVKDNDLWYFRKGDKDFKRLTNDKPYLKSMPVFRPMAGNRVYEE